MNDDYDKWYDDNDCREDTLEPLGSSELDVPPAVDLDMPTPIHWKKADTTQEQAQTKPTTEGEPEPATGGKPQASTDATDAERQQSMNAESQFLNAPDDVESPVGKFTLERSTAKSNVLKDEPTSKYNPIWNPLGIFGYHKTDHKAGEHTVKEDQVVDVPNPALERAKMHRMQTLKRMKRDEMEKVLMNWFNAKPDVSTVNQSSPDDKSTNAATTPPPLNLSPSVATLAKQPSQRSAYTS